MDLSTMRAKLETGSYPDRFVFEADFRLMIRNAKSYNPVDSFVYKETLKLETYFEQRTLLPLLEAAGTDSSHRMGADEQDNREGRTITAEAQAHGTPSSSNPSAACEDGQARQAEGAGDCYFSDI
jgi:hypothetical protein